MNALSLARVRECDAACCRESPRFPNADGSDCIYNVDASCELMSGKATMPDRRSVIFTDRSAREVFQETCVDWPQNTPVDKRRIDKTGGCCWQWVED